MSLSDDLISQFVKTTKDKETKKTETIAYGTIVERDGFMYVRLDGSKILTPVSSSEILRNTTAALKENDRVTVMVKNHTAVITGNLTSPSARIETVKEIQTDIMRVDTLISDKADIKDLEVESGRIDDLEADKVTVNNKLVATEADVDKLEAADVVIKEQLTANKASIDSLTANKADISDLDAATARIVDLEAKSLTVENADLKYANIDFTNIGKAAMEYFYAQSGLIDNVVVGDSTITGNLVGVTIKGDIIDGNTVVADKLVILGDDGLYYKLNTDGMTTDVEQTEYNSLNGSIITAKSITATKISVDDLVAFDATIGGFNITEHSIYSEVKDSEGNTTRGVYLDKDGQVNFGDADKYIKYYKDEEGNYFLAISADTILYNINGKQRSIADLGVIGEYVKIGIYEDEPCIELGELDSDFKLVITNTRIMFMEGSSIPAYISNQALHITKAVIEEEIQQGEFVWKVRANGNMGLMWKGDS